MAIIQGHAMQSSSRGFYPKTLNGSLRFNSLDGAYLEWTPVSAGTSGTTFTISVWFKISNLTPAQDLYLFAAGSPNTSLELFYVLIENASNDLRIQWRDQGNSTTRVLQTSRLFRDPSAWYHLVISVDTNASAVSDRMKVYINGELETSFVTDARSTLNSSSSLAATAAVYHTIGAFSGNTTYLWDGYMAEYFFIDGTAHTASDFGETKSGVWVPKNVTASDFTMGTNGFYLEFADNVNDSAGSNNWTANNIASNDYVSDNPTDNFATWNPLDKTGGTFVDGNLRYTHNTTTWVATRATMGISSGKMYFEVTLNNGWNYAHIGVHGDSALPATGASGYLGQSSDSWSYQSDGRRFNNNVETSVTETATTAGDVVMCAVDMDAGKIWWGVNGTWNESGNPSTGANAQYSNLTGTVRPAVAVYSSSSDLTANFGQQDFTYTPPTGFNALSTANLPDPDIDPAQDASPSDYFNTVLYTSNNIGAGGTQSVTGVGFQSDFTWIKNRTSSSTSHTLFDAVRGEGEMIKSDANSTEETDSIYGYLSSFDADGFTLTGGTTNANYINQSTDAYVSWNWKAGTSFSYSGETGTIDSVGSANTTSGFSIVTYTGSSVSMEERVKHGLSSAPEMIMVKSRSGADSWAVYHKDLSTNYFLELNFSYAQASGSNPRFLSGDYGTSTPTSTYFYVRNYSGSTTNDNGDDYVAYCFHSVDGFSKIGTYEGNNSTDNAFVYTGFRPAWIMIKNIDAVGNWGIWDTKRNEENVAYRIQRADTPDSEATAQPNNNIDLLSNGFKVRGDTGLSGDAVTYIYMAFAENPFKYATAR